MARLRIVTSLVFLVLAIGCTSGCFQSLTTVRLWEATTAHPHLSEAHLVDVDGRTRLWLEGGLQRSDARWFVEVPLDDEGQWPGALDVTPLFGDDEPLAALQRQMASRQRLAAQAEQVRLLMQEPPAWLRPRKISDDDQRRRVANLTAGGGQYLGQIIWPESRDVVRLYRFDGSRVTADQQRSRLPPEGEPRYVILPGHLPRHVPAASVLGAVVLTPLTLAIDVPIVIVNIPMLPFFFIAKARYPEVPLTSDGSGPIYRSFYEGRPSTTPAVGAD